ncbi:MAG TPA: Rieske (2Fe-2S) protein, partial [Candidatus Dormibacteraeota bacterium]|nr:Rieske (2Fe-2S) protein [Candidatus Dormibacteraeota bacterium]
SAARDLVAALNAAPEPDHDWDGHEGLAETILEAEPAVLLAEIVRLARSGVPATELSGAVAYAASRRALHFSVTNEVSDWETVHHAFTYANAVDQALRRAPDPLVARGILDAAMAVSLERFLNIPRKPVPVASGRHVTREAILALFDEHGAVDDAAQLVADALATDGQAHVIAVLGHALVREDSGFHEFQMFEAGVRQSRQLERRLGDHVLLGVTRYLAAHAPTRRARFQTFDVASRLQRGEELHAEAADV